MSLLDRPITIHMLSYAMARTRPLSSEGGLSAGGDGGLALLSFSSID